MRANEQPAVGRAIDRFIEHVRTACAERVLEVRLYGSSARDDWRPDSDIDLLVLVDRKDWELVKTVHDVWLAALVDDHADLSPRIVPMAEYDRMRADGQPFASAVEGEGRVLWTRRFARKSTVT